MGLDLYAGPLWRLYSGQIVRPTQRMGGMTGTIIYAPGAEPLTRQEAVEQVAALRRQIDVETGGRLPGDWNEKSDSYFSEQLGWDGLQSLVLLAAYNHRDDLVRPRQLPESLEDDRAYNEAVPGKYYVGPMAVIEAQMIVPGAGNQAMILAQLREEVWSDRVDIDGWFERGFAPTDGYVMVGVGEGKYERVEVDTVDDPVRHNGEYAFAVFTKALAFAEQHNVPITHDG
jgi:hypothetical protein